MYEQKKFPVNLLNQKFIFLCTQLSLGISQSAEQQEPASNVSHTTYNTLSKVRESLENINEGSLDSSSRSTSSSNSLSSSPNLENALQQVLEGSTSEDDDSFDSISSDISDSSFDNQLEKAKAYLNKAKECAQEQNWPLAIEYYKKSAHKGCSQSQHQLANHFKAGIIKDGQYVLKKDPANYIIYLKQAADNVIDQYPEALYDWALLCESDLGTLRDLDQSQVYYKKAADLGHVPSQVKLASLLIEKDIKRIKGDEIRSLIKKALDNNYPPALFIEGQFAYKPHYGREDQQLAFYFYQKSATQGHAPSIYKLGRLFDKNLVSSSQALGEVERKNQTLRYYFEASQKKHLRADYRLAKHYYKDAKNAQDMQKAIDMLLKAADSGEQKSMVLYAKLCMQGVVKDDFRLEKNPYTALDYYNRAFSKNSWKAALRLADIYSEGKIVKQNYNKSFDYYMKILKRSPQAQYAIAELYEKGLGVKKDLSLALKYYFKALKNNSDHALNDLSKYLLRTGSSYESLTINNDHKDIGSALSPLLNKIDNLISFYSSEKQKRSVLPDNGGIYTKYYENTIEILTREKNLVLSLKNPGIMINSLQLELPNDEKLNEKYTPFTLVQVSAGRYINFGKKNKELSKLWLNFFSDPGLYSIHSNLNIDFENSYTTTYNNYLVTVRDVHNSLLYKQNCTEQETKLLNEKLSFSTLVLEKEREHRDNHKFFTSLIEEIKGVFKSTQEYRNAYILKKYPKLVDLSAKKKVIDQKINLNSDNKEKVENINAVQPTDSKPAPTASNSQPDLKPASAAAPVDQTAKS